LLLDAGSSLGAWLLDGVAAASIRKVSQPLVGVGRKKRIFDGTCVIFILPLLLPIFLAIALACA
jgi:hypothetical protein